MKALRLILLVIMVGCTPVNTLYNPTTDFQAYSSFCWMESCAFRFTGPEYLNDSLVQGNIKQTIIKTLEKKGLRYSDEKPDLLVDFHVTVENEKVITYHNREDEPYYYRTTFMQKDEITLTKGTVIIHMVDHDKSELVWQSEAIGYLESPPDLSMKNIRKVISKVLKDFPPVQKK